MAKPSKAGKYVSIRESLWWDPKQPAQVHQTSDDSVFGSKGHRITISSVPTSVNYNPEAFNRVVRALKREGKPAPDEVDVDALPKRDDWRGRGIA